MKIWAFGILQRIARTGTDREHDDFITARMSQYLKIVDEAEATRNKTLLIQAAILKKDIPAQDFDSYLSARRRNHAANIKSIEMAADGVFDFLVIGMDDNAVYGPHRKERDSLVAKIEELGADNKVVIKPGADELAQLLAVRAKSYSEGRTPGVFVAVVRQDVLDSIPPLEDRPLHVSVEQALILAGAKRVADIRDADGVLLLHADDKYLVEDAHLAAELIRAGYRVSVADVSAVNAGSLEFTKKLGDTLGGLDRLVGYAGWNTAANSIGTAVSMLLAGGSSGNFLFERFADDVLFMGNVRPEMRRRGFTGAINGDRYVEMRETLLNLLREECDAFFRAYFDRTGKTSLRVDVRIPWFRLFEIDIEATTSQY